LEEKDYQTDSQSVATIHRKERQKLLLFVVAAVGIFFIG
jgi:hypothetical protein